MAMATATREGTVEAFLIEGCRPLSGTISPAGNKNAALPILAACLLTGEPVILENVPHIRDVEEMIELIAALGVDVEWHGAEHRAGVGGRGQRHQARPRAVHPHPRLDPAGRAAAGPLRGRRRAASWRRRDRPAPSGHPPDGVRRAGRGRAGRSRVPPTRPQRPRRRRDPPRRGQRHRHRERADGGRPRPRHNRDHERRLRAARAGPVPSALQDGRRASRVSARTCS